MEDGPALEEARASTAPTPGFVPTTSPVDNATATPGSFRLSPSLLSLSLSPLCSSPSPQFSLLSSSAFFPSFSFSFHAPLSFLLLLPFLLPRFLLVYSDLSLRVYSTGEAFHSPSALSLSSSSSSSTLLALLLRLRFSLSLSLEARERERENGETGETFSLSKLAATDSPLAGNGETVHHVRLKSVTTLHSLMPGLHDQLHFQRGPANYRYDCFRPRGPPDK